MRRALKSLERKGFLTSATEPDPLRYLGEGLDVVMTTRYLVVYRLADEHPPIPDDLEPLPGE